MKDEPREFHVAAVGAAVASAVGAFVSIGPIVVSTFGIFLSTFAREFGWSRTAYSLGILICALVGAAVTPGAGRLVDKWGVRRVMLPAVALFGLALMSVVLMQGRIWQFYLAYALIGVTAGFQNMVAYSKVVSVWFNRHRGLVLSLVSVCYGAAYAVMPKIVQPLIVLHGWRAGYLFLGALVIASLVVLIPLLHLPPDPQAPSVMTPTPLESGGDLSASQARRTSTFWIISSVVVLGVLSLVGTIAHLYPMLVDKGLTPVFATTTLSMFAIGGITGQLTYGIVVDRVNSPRVALPFFLAALIGISVLHYSTNAALLLGGAVLTGIGQGSELGLAAYFTGRYFGVRNLGEIYGYVYAAATVASGIGPVLMGYVFDRTGSYGYMLVAFQFALAGAVIGVWSLGPYIFAVKRH